MKNNYNTKLSYSHSSDSYAEGHHDNGEQTHQEFVVSTLDDENDGDFSAGDLSLREAIAQANDREGADTITFDASLSGGTIANSNNSLGRNLNIDDSLSIIGLGRDNLTVEVDYIFNVEADTDLKLDGLNLVGSKIDSSGNLTFSNSTISKTAEIGSADNSAIISRGTATIVDSSIQDNSGGGNVGIVIESGNATIERSAITGNDASAYAQSGIIVRSDAMVDIINSTIANNQARSNAGIESSGTVNVSNSTIANNSGGLGGGGIKTLNGGVTTITSSIVARNTGTDGSFPVGDISVSGDGEVISGGNNLIGNGDDAAGFVDGVNGDLVGSDGDDPNNPQSDLLIDPLLGDLQDNGGAIATFALQEGSPAIDAGSNPKNLATDGRGQGFMRTVGDGTDIGNYEVQHSNSEAILSELIVSTLKDENDGDFSAGNLSLREAIALANEREGIDTITFDESLTGEINLSGEYLVQESLVIQGRGSKIAIDVGDRDVITGISYSAVDDDNYSAKSAVSTTSARDIKGRDIVSGMADAEVDLVSNYSSPDSIDDLDFYTAEKAGISDTRMAVFDGSAEIDLFDRVEYSHHSENSFYDEI